MLTNRTAILTLRNNVIWFVLNSNQKPIVVCSSITVWHWKPCQLFANCQLPIAPMLIEKPLVNQRRLVGVNTTEGKLARSRLSCVNSQRLYGTDISPACFMYPKTRRVRLWGIARYLWPHYSGNKTLTHTTGHTYKRRTYTLTHMPTHTDARMHARTHTQTHTHTPYTHTVTHTHNTHTHTEFVFSN
jgi:hypothetical protein